MLRNLLILFVAVGSLSVAKGAEEELFSGPQIGERLAPFEALGLYGDLEGKPIDLIDESEGGPIMLIFFHELTRPGFGLMRAITKFAADRNEPKMKVGVVFLSEDVTETTKWATNVRRLLADDVAYVVSPDGKEGPGSYGLNRNVTLTILVGDDNKVTGNFALVQPQLQADGPGILKSIVAITGGGDVPSIEQLDSRYGRGMNMQRRGNGRTQPQGRGGAAADEKLTTLLRGVINKQATEAQVRAAAAKVEDYIGKNEAAKKELTRIVRTVVSSGRIENYGSSAAQATLRRWLKELTETDKDDDTESPDSTESDAKEDEA